MKVLELNDEFLPAFIEYCKTYGPEQDESYLPDANFVPGENDPAFVLLEGNKIAGAASLILHPEYRESRKSRFRIFHCLYKSAANYRALQDALLKNLNGIDKIYCFINENRPDVRRIWEEIGFSIERYSWLFERDLEGVTPPDYPDGFILDVMREGIDEQAWCDIINVCFSGIAGHTRLTPEKLKNFKSYPGYIEQGLLLLRYKNTPAGTMQLENETDDGKKTLFIEAAAVLPEYRGRGLGKNLIRSALKYAAGNGYEKAMLSVNAENENASALYLKEGFRKKKLYICYHKLLSQHTDC